MRERKIEIRNINDLILYENNPRNNDNAVDKVAESIKEFGFNVPVVIDKNDVVITGHTRIKACRKLNIENIPTIKAGDLSPEQVKAYRLADNKIGELAEWDFNMLENELEQLSEMDLDFDMTDFGFTSEDMNKSLLSGEEDEYLDINFEGKEGNTSFDRKLTFSNKTVIITEEEEEMLVEVFEDYVKEKGVMFGFVRWLLNER